MKKYLSILLIAVALVITPQVTHAGVLEDLYKQVIQLQQMILQLLTQRNATQTQVTIPAETNQVKLFLSQLQRDLLVSYPIKEGSKDVTLSVETGQSNRKTLSGYVFTHNLKNQTDFDHYFRSNSWQVDGLNSGDGTIIGQMGYRKGSIICTNYTESEKSEGTIFCADLGEDSFPSLGSATLHIYCSNECNLSNLNSWRSDFYVADNSGKKIKILIDIETRLRLVTGIDSDTPGNVEKLQKWEDFYPFFNGPTSGGSMPTSATIYGDYVGDSNTFKAKWIKWSIG